MIDPSRFQIIVAHFNKDLRWLDAFAANTFVYSKGNLPADPKQYHRVETLPNIGRESHTIAHHIYHNYDDLSDVLLFTQDDIYNEDSEFWPHCNLPLTTMVEMALDTPEYGMTTYAAMKATFKDWEGLWWIQYGEMQWLKVWGNSLTRARLSPAEFWNYLHGVEEHPRALHYHAHGLFAVRRETIRLKPRSFWARLLHYFEDLNAYNPEEGLYMERMWSAIFSDSHIIWNQPYIPIMASPVYTPVPYTMQECGPCMEQSAYIKRRLLGGIPAAEQRRAPPNEPTHLEERAQPEQIAVL